MTGAVEGYGVVAIVVCVGAQVCSVLESLEREYRRDEDWCSNDKAAPVTDKVAYMQQQINKHHEQKEAFLKVSNCDLSFIVQCNSV